MTTVRVRVNEARLQQFMYLKEIGKDAKGKPLYSRELRTLRPMTNLVPKEIVDQMRQNVAFMAKTMPGSKTNPALGDNEPAITIEDGDLPAETATTLDGMKALDAVKLVQETVDKGQLETWKLTAKGKVLAAIDTQLVKIDATLREEEKE